MSTSEKVAGLSTQQWVQWAVATAISTVVMVLSVLAWVDGHVYTRREGEKLEQRFTDFEDKVDRQLTSVHDKVTKMYEIMLTKKRVGN